MDHAKAIGLPSHRCSGTDAGKVVERAGFRVRSRPAAHERSTGRERPSSLPGVCDRVGGAAGCIIVATAWRMTGWPSSLGQSRSTCCSCRSTAETRRAACREHDGRRGGRPGGARSVRGLSCRIITTCLRLIRFPLTCSKPRPAGCRRGSSRESCVRRALGDHAVSITLGIDIGTSGTKTLAIDERGTILASASAEYPCDHPQPGLVRAGPGPLVGGDGKTRAAGPGSRQVPAGRRRRASA